ncbi:FemAB-like protein [candidate division KSB3 bacterium]|uniref:FemAB-like protein n=1 Tax=candidate division KSB3 bacterium TaxID=2044937 RepID=A0A2G6E7I4_9BACT|nr:MAG: FemAB-like protein [candidate division KSB3 bacterium]PIE30431.1 MAG: FemAB-like protein [candidate division KSB3 bacterium]
MQITQLESAQEELWDRYVSKASASALYHLSGWKRIVEKSFKHNTFYLYALEDEQIVGILPLVFLKSLPFGKFFVSLPFFNYGGILAENMEIRRALLDEAAVIARREGAEHIELRHLENFALHLPVKTSKVTMILDLPETSEDLWKRFKSKLRSQIRRPEKEGFHVKIGHAEELDSFYEVFAWKMRDLGTPVYSKRFFENILTEFPETARICTVYAGDQAIASGFVVGFKEMLQIPWASTLRAYDRFGSNMMLYWNILKFACEQGYTRFDFGRSTPDQGTYRFKKQWGAQPVQCYWHYWLANGDELPELNPHNPKYELAIKMWQHLPLSVTKLLGPHLVKYLP